MAMTPCKECGHQISTKAESCPSCGLALRHKKQLTSVDQLGYGCLMIIAIFVIIWIVGSIVS